MARLRGRRWERVWSGRPVVTGPSMADPGNVPIPRWRTHSGDIAVASPRGTVRCNAVVLQREWAPMHVIALSEVTAAMTAPGRRQGGRAGRADPARRAGPRRFLRHHRGTPARRRPHGRGRRRVPAARRGPGGGALQRHRRGPAGRELRRAAGHRPQRHRHRRADRRHREMLGFAARRPRDRLPRRPRHRSPDGADGRRRAAHGHPHGGGSAVHREPADRAPRRDGRRRRCRPRHDSGGRRRGRRPLRPRRRHAHRGRMPDVHATGPPPRHRRAVAGPLRLPAGCRVGHRRGRRAVAPPVPADHQPVPRPAARARSPSPASTWSSGTFRACCNRSPRWACRHCGRRSPRCSPRSGCGSRSSTSAAASTAT